jgi:hypothetical protein
MVHISQKSRYNQGCLHSTVHEYNQPLLKDGVSVCCLKQTTVFKWGKKSDALSNVDSTMDKEAKSSAEVTSLSIRTLQPTVFLIPAAVAYSF